MHHKKTILVFITKNNMKKVQTDKAPAAIGPYSQAMVSGKFLFSSGQVPLDPETGAAVGSTIQEQAERCCLSIQAILEACGAGFENVVKTTCFLSDMDNFAAFNQVYSKYFTGKPARSCVAVKTIPKNLLFEIEFIAELP